MSAELDILLKRVRSMAGTKEADDAFSALCDRFSPMLGAMARRFADGACEADFAELSQEARFALFRAAQNYDLENGAVTFGLYARVCIRNALVSYCRKRSRDLPVCSIDELDEVLLPQNEEPLGAMIAAERLDAIYRKVGEVLSSFERRVFDLYMEEETISAIAQRLGKDEKSVSNAVYRILTKLRRVL